MDQNCRKRILSEDYADFMVDYGDMLNDILSKMDACYDILNEDTAVVYIPVNGLPEDLIHIYGYGAYPNCYGLLDLTAVEESGIDKVRNIPNLNLRGQGVFIGIIDTGIDYTHEVFKKADGTSKVWSIWDQSIDSENEMPEGFSFGTEYTQEQINIALTSADPFSVVPSKDENGHGTFLAGIATGNSDKKNGFSGVVPDAELVVVKLKQAKKYIRDFWKIPDGVVCFQKNDFIHAIRYLVEKATKGNRPISIIIGIGTSQGGHDERGALSRYLSSVAGMSGVAVTIAAGNEGYTRHHYHGKVNGVSKFDTVELIVGANEKGFTMEFWGKTPTTFSIDITSPSGEHIVRIPARLKETRVIKFIFEITTIYVDYNIVEAQSGDQMILVRFENPMEGVWRFRVYSSGNLTLNYHVWLPMNQFLGNKTYFANSDPEYTLTSPGNTFIPIVATAYDHRTKNLYLNASRGYLRNDNIAPTIAAPGVNIVGPALNNSYSTASGTSLSAAHAAGIAAMFLEWGIVRGNLDNISTVEIRNLLIRGAIRFPNIHYPNKDWGYGIINLYNAYFSLVEDSI